MLPNTQLYISITQYHIIILSGYSQFDSHESEVIIMRRKYDSQNMSILQL